MFFTKSAAARILNVKPHLIKLIVAESDGVSIQVGDEPSQKIPVSKFAEDFAGFRKKGADGLISSPVHSHVYSVLNPKKGTNYIVKTKPKGLVCQCKDWLNSMITFRQGICKHSYRVLFDLGFTSLQEYVEEMKKKDEEVLPVAPKAPNVLDLETMKLPKLKELAAGWGVVPAGDKRYRKTWITALQDYARNYVSTLAKEINHPLPQIV